MSDSSTRVEEVRLYIVRLWSASDSSGDVRAAVLRAGSDESAWFTRAEALAEFFARQVRPTVDGTGERERT
jgi:hypothetical protein